MLINTELQKSCYYLYKYYNNIKQTRDENREKCKQGDSSSVVDPIPNSPNQHHKNYTADSKNNTEEILWGERINITHKLPDSVFGLNFKILKNVNILFAICSGSSSRRSILCC